MLVIKGYVQQHKLILAILLLAAATPSVFLAVPAIVSAVGALPVQAKFAVIGFSLASCGVALMFSARWLRRVVSRALQSLEAFDKRRQEAKTASSNAREWKRYFEDGNASGSDKVAIIEESAGNITNISRESSSLDAELKAELAVGRRKVTVVADTSPGVEIDTPPELRITETGEKGAAFFKKPVRDEVEPAIQHTLQSLPYQLPFLNSFLKGCEPQVGTHIVAHGCTSLIDAIHGFAPRSRGTEANAHFFITESSRKDLPQSMVFNGHGESAEIPAVPVMAGVTCENQEHLPKLNRTAARSGGRREVKIDRRDLREHLMDLETEFTDMAAVQRDLVFLISNKDGVKENRKIRDIVDVFCSACLRNFSPLGAPAKPVGMDFADISHVPPAAWIPSEALSFSDPHAAFGAAREISKGQWNTPFFWFAPDKTPLAHRDMAATFVTGNPRIGQEFINHLDRALPIDNVVIAHWNQEASTAWALFCVPATPFEVKSAGLRLDLDTFA